MSAEKRILTPEEEEKRASNRFSFIVGIGIGAAIIVFLTILSLYVH